MLRIKIFIRQKMKRIATSMHFIHAETQRCVSLFVWQRIMMRLIRMCSVCFASRLPYCIHPFSILASPASRVAEGSWVVTPLTCQQFIVGPQNHSHSNSLLQTDTFRVPDLPHVLVFWTVEGSRRTRRKPTQTKGELPNSTQ